MIFSFDTAMKNDTGEDRLGKPLDLATRRPLMTSKGPVSAAILQGVEQVWVMMKKRWLLCLISTWE